MFRSVRRARYPIETRNVRLKPVRLYRSVPIDESLVPHELGITK